MNNKKRQTSKFYPYFNLSERPTIDHFVGLFNMVIFKRQDVLTDFLNPGEQNILKAVVGKEITYKTFGGFSNAEKRRVYLEAVPHKVPLSDFHIALFEIGYPHRFDRLTHSSILGTLANTGVKLKTFGDIITDGQGRWQFFAEEELVSFFQDQIQRIGRNHVRLKELNLNQALLPADDAKEESFIVASLRIDILLAKASRQSRSQIKRCFSQKEVQLNWHEVMNSNIMVKIGDVVSLRHFGRLRIVKVSRTKKAKYRVVSKLWQAKKSRR